MSLVSVAGTLTGDVEMEIITGMQKNSEDGWVVLLAFNLGQTGANSHDPGRVTQGLLKYARWNVTELGGATAISFGMRGMLRPER